MGVFGPSVDERKSYIMATLAVAMPRYIYEPHIRAIQRKLHLPAPWLVTTGLEDFRSLLGNGWIDERMLTPEQILENDQWLEKWGKVEEGYRIPVTLDMVGKIFRQREGIPALEDLGLPSVLTSQTGTYNPLAVGTTSHPGYRLTALGAQQHLFRERYSALELRAQEVQITQK